MHKRQNRYAYTVKKRRFAIWAFIKVSGDSSVVLSFYVMIMALKAD